MIWIIGDKGMLGRELSGLLTARGLDNSGTDREVSILDPGAISGYAEASAREGRAVTAMVNCAAYTSVEKAEDEPELASALNVEGPANLARLADRLGADFIHLSTDYVFSGNRTVPYREDDPVDPQGVYGRTKAEGERAVLANCRKAIILRTAWLYGRYGTNFVFTMLRLMRDRAEVGVVRDQYGTPTWALDLSATIASILESREKLPGIYHYTDGGITNWHEFAMEVYAQGRALGLLTHEVNVKPLTTDQYPAKVKRPAYSVLSKEKIARVYAPAIPDWRVSLRRFLSGEAATAPHGVAQG